MDDILTMYKIKYIKWLFVLFISCDLPIGNITTSQSSANSLDGIHFKHTATYIYNGFNDSIREDYVYVYNYKIIDNIESKYQMFIDSNIRIDNKKQHLIYFLNYNENLPDTGGYDKNNDLSGGKFSKYIIFQFAYVPRTNIKEYIYWNNEVIEKVKRLE